MTKRRAVSVLKDGRPKIVATCSSGYDTGNEQCPEPNLGVWAKMDAHWNTAPDQSDPVPASRMAALWKFDPDIDPSTTDQAWMHDCVSSSVYPCGNVSRPSSKSDASSR
jgi:hypothetical protein